MKIILRHIIKNIIENRFRSFLIILSLAIASAVFYVNLNISSDVTENSKMLYRGIGKGFTLYVSGAGVENVKVDGCEDKFFVENTAATYGDIQVSLIKTDWLALAKRRLVTLNEDLPLPDSVSDADAVISRKKALNRHISIGDTLETDVDGTPYTVRIVAFAESLGIFSDSDQNRLELLVFDSGYSPDTMFVKLYDDSGTESAKESLREAYPSLTFKTLYDHAGSGGRLDSIRRLVAMILLLVTVIAVYVISSTVSLIIDYRIPVLGTFRSIGASAKSIGLMLILENVMYGLVSGAFGLVLGIGIRHLVRVKYFAMGVGDANILYVLFVPVFAVSVNFFTTLFAIIKTSRKGIKELIFNRQNTASNYPLAAGIAGVVLIAASVAIAVFNKTYDFILLIVELALAIVGVDLFCGLFAKLISAVFSRLALKRFGGSAWMGIKSYSTSKINRTTAVLVSTVMALVLVVYLCVGSMNNFFEQYQKNYPYDVFVKGTEQPTEFYNYINELEGVKKVKYEYWTFETIPINSDIRRCVLVSRNGYPNGIEANDKTWGKLENGTVLVDTLFANRNGYKIGDTLTFTQKFNFSVKIAGFCDSTVFTSDRNAIILTSGDYFKYVKTAPAVIGIMASGDTDKLISDINDANALHGEFHLSVNTPEQYIDSDMTDAMNALKSASAVPILVTVLAVLGLVNNQLIAYNQKRLMYAVLYSTSMSRKQIKQMMLWELSFTFITGCLLGAASSIWIIKIVRDIIFVTVAYVHISASPILIVFAVAFLFGMLCITAVFPISHLRKMSIIKEIQYE